MSEPVLKSEEAGAAASRGVAPKGYGARLAWERQRAGLGVTDVAAELRLHPNQVRAIEQEDLTRLPELAYVRGFLRSYARVVKVDPALILDDLNAKLEPAPATGGASALSSEHAVTQGAERERSSGLMIGVALVVLIALGLIGWVATRPDSQLQQVPAPPATIMPAPAPPAATPTTENAPPAQQSAAPSAVATEPFPPAADAESAIAAVSASAMAPALFVRFNGASWAEVTDAGGKILFSQMSVPGAEHAIDGQLPLTVVIGDASKATVEVKGEAFNLQPITRNNVARFIIK
ncbi:MAG: DUF4115 domain-containing protein [Burkholderiaceae bacterium]|nr:DUF4115 domain-containing protein [Burkholderiaceae bacterium]